MGGEKVRGELGEIKTTLAGLSSVAGNKPEMLTAKKEVFKKIISYMTVGIDMSSLFMQSMTCAVQHGDDVVLKKMLYLYICTYAQSNPDLTLLTINLLTKDSKDQDPHIRGLAIRSLCSLRIANLVEYLVSTAAVERFSASSDRSLQYPCGPSGASLGLMLSAGPGYITGLDRSALVCSPYGRHGCLEGL